MHTTVTAVRVIVGARHLVDLRTADGQLVARLEPNDALIIADEMLEAAVLPAPRPALAAVEPLAITA